MNKQMNIVPIVSMDFMKIYVESAKYHFQQRRIKSQTMIFEPDSIFPSHEYNRDENNKKGNLCMWVAQTSVIC